MYRRRFLLFVPSLALAIVLVGGQVHANGPDPDRDAARAQERLDRDQQRASERSDEVAARFAEERTRIDERAIRDPDKAAQDLAKLEADRIQEDQKIAEDAAKTTEDFAEDSAKAAENAAEDLAKLSEDSGDDNGNLGSSEQIRDLGANEGAEHDAEGYPVRRGELVAIDLAPTTLSAAQARGFRVIETQRFESLSRNVIRLAAPQGLTALEARGQLLAIDPQAVVDLVHYYGLNLTAGSHGKRTRAPRVVTGGRSRPLTIGMIDTSVTRHSSLAGSEIVPWAAGSFASAPVEHGTAVASILANEGGARIYVANIFRGPANRPFTSADVIAQALEWMSAQDVPIVNMSLAGPRNAVLDRLIRDALAQGHQVVAAAGNGGPTAPPAYPAAVPGVVAVTAVDKDLHIYRYANHGRYITVAAKGVGVIAARSAGGFAEFNGTSFATPHVAVWMARCRAGGTGAGVCRERLRQAARDIGPSGFDETYGYGFID